MLCDKSLLVWYEQQFLDQWKPEYNNARLANYTPGPEITEEFRSKISKIHRGKIIEGWHKEAVRQANMGNSNASKTYNIKVQSPSGKIFDGIQNLYKFCRDNNITSPGTFYQFLTGTKKSYKDWRIVR